MTQVEVADNTELSRYEARIDGAVAGFAKYRRRPGRIIFTHTEVDPAFEGSGVGGVLARGALDAVRADGSLTVVPLCPFIRAWIERHHDYQDLVAAEHARQAR